MKNCLKKLFCLIMAVVLFTALFACSENVDESRENLGKASLASESKDNSTSESSDDSSMPSATTEEITVEKAKAIFQVMLNQMFHIEAEIFNGYGYYENRVDVEKTLPSDSLYVLISDNRLPLSFKSIAKLRKYIEKTYTSECLDRPDSFYSRLINSERPLFKEYDDKLYIRYEEKGNIFGVQFLPDSLLILNKDENMLKIQVDTKLSNKPSNKAVFIFKKIDGYWYADCTLDEVCYNNISKEKIKEEFTVNQSVLVDLDKSYDELVKKYGPEIEPMNWKGLDVPRFEYGGIGNNFEDNDYLYPDMKCVSVLVKVKDVFPNFNEQRTPEEISRLYKGLSSLHGGMTWDNDLNKIPYEAYVYQTEQSFYMFRIDLSPERIVDGESIMQIFTMDLPSQKADAVASSSPSEYIPGSIKLNQNFTSKYRLCFYTWTSDQFVNMGSSAAGNYELLVMWYQDVYSAQSDLVDEEPREMYMKAMIEYFNIPREEFDIVLEEVRQSDLEDGCDITEEECEILNADVIYTFDDEIINNYYLRK